MPDNQPRILRVILAYINLMNAKIDMNHDEALLAIAEVKTTVDKIAVESAASVAAITDLEAKLAAALAAGQVVPADIVDAIATLKSSVVAIDALVPDAPAPSL